MDNIGGYSDIEMIFKDDINSITEDAAGKVSISLNPSGEWIKLPFQGKNTKIESKPKNEDPGTIYDNTVSLLVPHQYLKEELCQNIKKALYSFCIIRYTTVMGETFIIGGTEYPLQLTSQKMHPGSASGISGWQLEFTGKSTYPQRLIK
jgi:hypothetical protein